MAVDYGKKRVGIAVSDPGRMIAQGLTTVPAHKIWEFIQEYLEREEIDEFVVGYPRQMNNEPSEAIRWINPFVKKLNKTYPSKKITLYDERFTSVLAHQDIIAGGVKKEKRKDKALVDKVSATIILQGYMEQIKNY